jgi:hypothetical protein
MRGSSASWSGRDGMSTDVHVQDLATARVQAMPDVLSLMAVFTAWALCRILSADMQGEDRDL